MPKQPTTSQDFSIRPADQKMVHEVRSFLMSVFAPLLYDELSRSLEELDKRALRANCEIVCMFSQEEMIASLQVEWHNEYVHINLLGVHPAYRGKGIPERMVAWLEEECRRRGIARIEGETLEEWQTRHRFYKWLGFIKGESFIRDGVHYRKFRKFIAPLHSVSKIS